MKMLFKLILFIGFVSCVSNNSPEAVLKNFEAELARGNVTNNSLDEWLTEDAIKKFKLEKRFSGKNFLKKFKVIYSNCVNGICSFTYDVSYKSSKGRNTAVVDVRKQAVLNNFGNVWLIDEIDIIKTYIESSDPVDI